MNKSDPQPAAPQAKSTRRWRRVFLLAVVLLIAVMVHLFWPVTPPAHALLAYMPPEMAVGFEVRDGSGLWKEIRGNGDLERILDSSLADGLAPLIPYADVHQLDPRDTLHSIATNIDDRLSANAGFLSRALSGSVAVATSDTRGKDLVVIAHTDNLSLWALRGALALRGRPLPGHASLPACLTEPGPGGSTFTITLHRNLIVAATSPARLAQTLLRISSLGDAPALLQKKEFPARSVLVHVAPNDDYREAVSRRIGHEFWFAQDGLATITLQRGGVHFETITRLRPQVIDAYRRIARERGVPDLPPSAGMSPSKGASLRFPRGGISLDGWVEAPFLWHSLSLRLWDAPARPLRGDSRPVTVLLWDLIDKGVIQHADGMFALLLQPAPADRGDGVIPAAPEVLGTWGVRVPPTDALQAFAEPARALAEWYAAPGGPEMYEQVRAKTKVEMIDDTALRVQLHPLFFNQQELRVEGKPGTKRLSFGNHGRAGDAAEWFPHTETFSEEVEEHFAFVSLEWSSSPAATHSVKALLEDKMIRHAFVPEAYHPTVRLGLDLFERAAETFERGGATFQFIHDRVPRTHAPSSEDTPAAYLVRSDIWIKF